MQPHFKLMKTMSVSIPTSLLLISGLAAFGFQDYYKNYESSFELFTSSIRESSQKTFLISRLVENAYNYGSDDFSQYYDSVIVIGDDSNSHRAMNLVGDMAYVNSRLPYTFEGEDVIYYKDHTEHFAIVPSGTVDDFTNDHWFDGRCLEVENCTRTATPFDISDGVHISTVHNDISGDGGKIITISSPIYSHADPENHTIMGDVNIDLRISDYPFLVGQKLDTIRNTKVVRELQISPLGEFFFPKLGFSFYTELDNIHKVRVTVPIELYLHQFTAVFILIFIVITGAVAAFNHVLDSRGYVLSLIKRSHTDSMTSAYNRHILLDDGFKEAVSRGGSLLSIDGNNIKGINDTHGHKVGDIAIQSIANAISHSIRSTDYSIRVGGDEFLVVLPRCGERSAENVQQKIEDYLALKTAFEYAELTITTGVSIFSDSFDLELAIERADHSMYINKQTGRSK